MDVHGSVGDVLKHCVIGPSEPVGFLHRLVVPVGPVHKVFKQRDGKGVGHFTLHHNVSVCAICVSISNKEEILTLLQSVHIKIMIATSKMCIQVKS